MNEDELLKLIAGWQNNDAKATEKLMVLAYAKVKALSVKQQQNLPNDANTAIIIQSATDIAHDAMVKLGQTKSKLPIESIREFYSYLNAAVRNTFIDNYTKQVKRQQRNPDNTSLFSETAINTEDHSLHFFSEKLDLFKKLSLFTDEFPRQGEAVQLKYFAQQSNKEIAHLQQVSVRTVENDLRFAKTWLKTNI